MNKYVVERLRIMYASGKYDKLQLLLANKDVVKGQDIEGILDYSVLPEVKLELKQRIYEVPLAQMYYAEYQDALRKLSEQAEVTELSGSKHFPYKERKTILDDILKSKMENLKEIRLDELRGFYLVDEGYEG